MSTKEKIIAILDNIEDENLLSELLEMIRLEVESSDDPVYLNDQQKQSLKKGLDDLSNGRSYSHKKVWELTKEWLRKQ